MLAEANADLIIRSEDESKPFVTGERVQSFYFGGDVPETGVPTANGGGGLGESADGAFYPGRLEVLADKPNEWQIFFDDGDEETVR